MFSMTTTELSTTMPKSIAPRLNSDAAIPMYHIPMNPTIIDSGMAAAAISPARRFPSSRNSSRMTR